MIDEHNAFDQPHGMRRALTTAARSIADPWPAETAPLASASAPPPSWCASAAVFDAEASSLFPRLWHPVAAAADVAAPGNVVGARVAGQPVLVTATAGGLRAFVNSCRHQGSLLTLLDNTGRACDGVIACPYHGWTYKLDGRLASAPRLGGAADFKARDAGLLPAGRAAAWGPLAFVKLADDDKDDGTGPVPPAVADALAAAGVPASAGDAASFQIVTRKTFTVRANWKVVVANFADGGYHVPIAHPDLAAGLDLDRYERLLLADGCSLQTVPPAAAAPARLASASASDPTPAAYAYLWPFTFVNRYGPWLDVNLIRPVAVDETHVVYAWLRDAAAPPADAAELEADIAASCRVQEEDTALCENVQAGLSARGATGGRYAPRLEGPLFHFHRRVAAAYREVGMLL